MDIHLVAKKMTQLIETVNAALAAGSVANALSSVQENEARQAMLALRLVGAEGDEPQESSPDGTVALTAG